MALFGVIKVHQAEKIGIYTETVKWEAPRGLKNAVTRLLGKVGFPIVSVALDLCQDRLTDLLTFLYREEIDRKRVDEKWVEIVMMYSDLVQAASLITRRTATAAMRQKARQTSPKLRKTAGQIYISQYLQSKAQLTRLRDPSKRPSSTDKFILAEAAFLNDKYNTEEPTVMLLASTDMAFSPKLRSEGTVMSESVTQEIKKRFSVICDWPERVARTLVKVLH